ncbi:glycosyltransferase [Microlunatus capsulatus]|uniref:4,4'-diaponeurosporenoate glycosyltransferase n=1 Tax=Microlunatus capsulatus TaxID=99117 RepID=A0ABS4ZCS8_9ACTN|nr:glycosyltransferase [Microlunatus capsulatus]MBP2418560.1 glycosyltransferase involved in cell wall biosynthesis [Microlunatus capsulatus]
MTSVVIAAHDEAAVIERCLEGLRANGPGLDVVVVANGCADDTADRARRAGARVLELAAPGKAAALDAGDAVASSFPRLYLDADIVVPSGGVAALVAALGQPDGVLAAVPSRRVDVSGRPLLVRAYFAVNGRLPAYRDGLFGRGLIAVSDRGRSRFTGFPRMVADDLFLDSLFGPEEKRTVTSVVVVVEAPRRSRDLLRRLVRVRRGNAAMRRAGVKGLVTATIRPADRWAWWGVVRTRPQLWPSAAVYVGITTAAALWARMTPGAKGWARDDSTRGSSPGSAAEEAA